MVTSIYSLGGLLAASLSGHLAGHLGRKKLSLLTCVPFTLGPLIMGTSTTIGGLQLGRFIAGLGAGAALVGVPLYLNDISPPELRGRLGFMSQLAINIGILFAQTMGYAFSDYGHWRYIFLVASAVAVVQAVVLVAWTPESPKWLVAAGRYDEARVALQYLRETSEVDVELDEYLNGTGMVTSSSTPTEDKKHRASFAATETQALLSETVTYDTEQELAAGGDANPKQSLEPPANDGVWTFLSATKYRRMLIAVTGVMAFQQFCGVNSIVFYGVAVLADLMPQVAPLLNCIISTLNCFVTVLSAHIVDKHGRKVLLVSSIAGMSFASFTLAWGMIYAHAIVSALSATLFVVSFALGLGPVPFMIIPELVPSKVSNAAQSVGSTVNWFSNFLVVSVFFIN